MARRQPGAAHGGAAPSPLAGRSRRRARRLGARDDAPRLDADLDGDYDDAGAVIMDALWRPDRRRGDAAGLRRPDRRPRRRPQPRAALAGQSYVDKDLRTLLGDPVRGRFNLSYCGNGSLDACRASLWAAVEQVAGRARRRAGAGRRRAGAATAARTGFTPGLIPDTIRATNRPTFQQVLELAHKLCRGR